MTTPPKPATGRARHGIDPVLHHLGHVYRRDIRNGERLISRRYGIRMTEFVVLHMLALNGAMTLRDIAELELPFGRRAKVREVTHESGLRMIRLVLREGTRITQVDMDESAARQLAGVLAAAAEPRE